MQTQTIALGTPLKEILPDLISYRAQMISLEAKHLPTRPTLQKCAAAFSSVSMPFDMNLSTDEIRELLLSYNACSSTLLCGEFDILLVEWLCAHLKRSTKADIYRILQHVNETSLIEAEGLNSQLFRFLGADWVLEQLDSCDNALDGFILVEFVSCSMRSPDTIVTSEGQNNIRVAIDSLLPRVFAFQWQDELRDFCLRFSVLLKCILTLRRVHEAGVGAAQGIARSYIEHSKWHHVSFIAHLLTESKDSPQSFTPCSLPPFYNERSPLICAHPFLRDEYLVPHLQKMIQSNRAMRIEDVMHMLSAATFLCYNDDVSLTELIATMLKKAHQELKTAKLRKSTFSELLRVSLLTIRMTVTLPPNVFTPEIKGVELQNEIDHRLRSISLKKITCENWSDIVALYSLLSDGLILEGWTSACEALKIFCVENVADMPPEYRASVLEALEKHMTHYARNSKLNSSSLDEILEKYIAAVFSYLQKLSVDDVVRSLASAIRLGYVFLPEDIANYTKNIVEAPSSAVFPPCVLCLFQYLTKNRPRVHIDAILHLANYLAREASNLDEEQLIQVLRNLHESRLKYDALQTKLYHRLMELPLSSQHAVNILFMLEEFGNRTLSVVNHLAGTALQDLNNLPLVLEVCVHQNLCSVDALVSVADSNAKLKNVMKAFLDAPEENCNKWVIAFFRLFQRLPTPRQVNMFEIVSSRLLSATLSPHAELCKTALLVSRCRRHHEFAIGSSLVNQTRDALKLATKMFRLAELDISIKSGKKAIGQTPSQRKPLDISRFNEKGSARAFFSDVVQCIYMISGAPVPSVIASEGITTASNFPEDIESTITECLTALVPTVTEAMESISISEISTILISYVRYPLSAVPLFVSRLCRAVHIHKKELDHATASLFLYCLTVLKVRDAHTMSTLMRIIERGNTKVKALGHLSGTSMLLYKNALNNLRRSGVEAQTKFHAD